MDADIFDFIEWERELKLTAWESLVALKERRFHEAKAGIVHAKELIEQMQAANRDLYGKHPRGQW